jgi:hypothetical protein
MNTTSHRKVGMAIEKTVERYLIQNGLNHGTTKLLLLLWRN